MTTIPRRRGSFYYFVVCSNHVLPKIAGNYKTGFSVPSKRCMSYVCQRVKDAILGGVGLYVIIVCQKFAPFTSMQSTYLRKNVFIKRSRTESMYLGCYVHTVCALLQMYCEYFSLATLAAHSIHLIALFVKPFLST
jgi:hypothetical protein